MTIESTDELTHLDGVPVRVWRGITARGVPCFVFVHRLAVRDDLDVAEFERELRETLPPEAANVPRERAPDADEAAARAAGRAVGVDLDRFNLLARSIGNAVKRGIQNAGGEGAVGFGLFMFSFGDGGWMTWLSNAERQAIIPALREWIAKNEAPPPKARS